MEYQTNGTCPIPEITESIARVWQQVATCNAIEALYDGHIPRFDQGPPRKLLLQRSNVVLDEVTIEPSEVVVGQR